jgi:hypothetical protein
MMRKILGAILFAVVLVFACATAPATIAAWLLMDDDS